MRRLFVVIVAVLLAAAGVGTAVVCVHARSNAAPASPVTFRNPLSLKLPDGSQAENCADPDVARGTGNDSLWYLYCTSDAIDAHEVNSAGGPEQHLIPMYRSVDLVHWTYVGDAFRSVPSWVAKDAGLWAPEIQHRGGRWLLYFTASDTSLPGGGSAVGVATSSSPTGPWTDSGRAVVAPADNPTSPGDRRWTYDPEVVTAQGRPYLYFGSYFGGIFVRQLSTDGLSTIASTERRVAIANRYEGTNIVRRGGWFYFLGSSTNCCAGALTGYSVFAARSRSPLGPFKDADGRSILDSRVGGTPVLTQNGNRWVGPGHDSVFADAAGQDWAVYHAVDRTDPYVPGTTDYTQRPVLLDRIEWLHGWPTVRGGAGPSDSEQPGPAAQPGQHESASPRSSVVAWPGRTVAALSDGFSGRTLSRQWAWVRPPTSGSVTLAGGALRWATQDADLHPPTVPLASVLTEPTPRGDYVVEVKLGTAVPAGGDLGHYVQGGVLIYGSVEHYVKLAVTSIFETRQTEFGVQDSGQPEGAPTYGNGVVGPVGTTWTWLRITKHQIEAASAYTASTSIDGRHWRTGGTWVTDLGAAPRIGLISMGGTGYTTLVDSVRVSALRHP